MDESACGSTTHDLPSIYAHDRRSMRAKIPSTLPTLDSTIILEIT